jgi:hypothetical protein
MAARILRCARVGNRMATSMKWDKSTVQSSTRADAGSLPASLFVPVNPPLAIDPSWTLIEEGFSPKREHEIESILTVANGYIGTRGSLAEGVSLSPATFLAGVFEAGDDSAVSLELVTLPDWTQLRILVEQVPLSLEGGEILAHRRVLDLRHGLLFRAWRHRDRVGRVTSLQFVRMVSLHDRHLLLQSIAIQAENYSGVISVESLTEEPCGRIPWVSKLEGEAAIIMNIPYPTDFLFQAFEKAGIMLCCRSVGSVHTSYVALSACLLRANRLRRRP